MRFECQTTVGIQIINVDRQCLLKNNTIKYCWVIGLPERTETTQFIFTIIFITDTNQVHTITNTFTMDDRITVPIGLLHL